MWISWMTALLGLLLDFSLLLLTLVLPEPVAWLVNVRLALFAVQMFDVVVGRPHSKVTELSSPSPSHILPLRAILPNAFVIWIRDAKAVIPTLPSNACPEIS